MPRALLLSSLTLLCLLPSVARADLADAKRVLATSCARCHTAQPGAKGAKGPNGAPDLVALVRRKSSAEIVAWVKAPSKINPETTCDTSALDPRYANDLVSYLVGLTSAAPARRTPRRR
jgi:mono/diheme cytochrome c family protein